MLYNNWLSDVASRFQRSFEEIQATHNFEYGDEFEVAVCKLLRALLPRQYGVCRGFVVARTGEHAGDDIIVFDAGRFPTLRALGMDDLSRMEYVPAEAVLAYIEAKHTLTGETLSKATKQVEQVKAIPRPPVDLSRRISGINLKGISIQPPKDFPAICNPYYAAIWARQEKMDSEDSYRAFAYKMAELERQRAELPDAIVAGKLLALPLVFTSGPTDLGPTVSIKPFLCESTELGCMMQEASPWGTAFAHLLWAIEWIRLGDLPWSDMLSEQISRRALSHGTPPLRGTKFDPNPEG